MGRRGLSSTSASSSSSSSSQDYLGITFFTGICLGTACLGTWQVQRYYWKIGVIEDSKRMLKEPVSTLPIGGEQFQLPELVGELKGRRVAVTGRYEHDREVLVGPRSAPAGLFGAPAQGMAMNPQGYFVFTPFRREDGTVVFVNRGWISDAVEAWDRPKGLVTEIAVVGSCEKSGTFSPENNPSCGKLLWLEGAALLAASGHKGLDSTVVLERIVPDDEKMEYYPACRRASDLDKHHVTPETHAVYAVTWYSLCAFGLAATYHMFRKKARRRRLR